MNDSFISRHLNNSAKFYSRSFKLFNFYKKAGMATVFLVSRVKENSKYQEVYGSTYGSTLLNDPETETKTISLIVNLQKLLDIWNIQSDSLEVYDVEELVERGDILTYKRGSNTFSFKVSEVKSFTEQPQILYMFTLVPIKETNM